jgi:hypothetical protein
MQSVSWRSARHGRSRHDRRTQVADRGCALACRASAAGQVTTADIVASVADASAAVPPGITVTVDNLGTHETRVVPTNQSGDCTFTLLPIGRCRLRRAQLFRDHRPETEARSPAPAARFRARRSSRKLLF